MRLAQVEKFEQELDKQFPLDGRSKAAPQDIPATMRRPKGR